jgi:L-methionine (R)-S-oxide reductase
VNWAGFYIRSDKFPGAAQPQSSEPEPKKTLLLGPFQGKPACQLIQFGRGVCGTAAADGKSLIVPDVLAWPGHIACDAESRSEIVVPVVVGGETAAIIDVDCTVTGGFDEVDRKGLEDLARLIAECCDW